jgi:hypothetical protein
VKLREMLRWLNNAVRPTHVAGGQPKGELPDRDDAFVTAFKHDTAPINWVPSQQDDGPTHDGGVL